MLTCKNILAPLHSKLEESGGNESMNTEHLDSGVIVLQIVKLSVCIVTVNPVLGKCDKVTKGQQYQCKNILISLSTPVWLLTKC